MKEDPVTHQQLVEPSLTFRIFKYTVYVLLMLDVLLFLQEDLLAAREMLGDDIGLQNFFTAYTATIDTAAWVVLLLLFELETAIIPDEKLRGGLKWGLLAVRSACYVFIVLMAYNYLVKLGMISNISPFTIAQVCDLIGTGFTYVADMDEYMPLDAASCAALQGQELFRVNGTEIIGSGEAFAAAARLAVVDVVNATDWLIVVALLEIEVLLQLRDRLTDRLIFVFKGIKAVLYAVLFLCAIYWGIYGDFLDFWDAFLWLVAFIFIELNIFQWHAEVEEEKAQAPL
jgi:hypothetical protein